MSQDTTTEPTVDSNTNRDDQQPLRKRPVSDVLSDEQNKSYLTYTAVLFAIVGAGFGLTGAFGTRMIFDGSSESGFGMAFFMIALFGVMVLTGPILGAVGGLQLQQRMSDTREALITAFVGGTAGYIVMTIVGILVTVMLTPSTDSADASGSSGPNFFELGDVLVPLVVMAIPTGLVAAGMIYIDDRFL